MAASRPFRGNREPEGPFGDELTSGMAVSSLLNLNLDLTTGICLEALGRYAVEKDRGQ